MAKKLAKKQDDDQEAASVAGTGTAEAVRPTTDTNIVTQLLLGLVGTVVTAFGTRPLNGTKLTYLYGIINERGPVQYFELFMFFMCATLIYQKSRIIRNQMRIVYEEPIGPDLNLTDDEQISGMRAQIRKRAEIAWSIVLNRIDRLMALWLSSKDVGRVSSWLGAESGRDTSAADSSYANARVLIWAIPIMGFIGTVLGLGRALAGFSDFLASSAELSEIKAAIQGVTSGLGVAFDTTLLALILTTFLMFPLTAIQRKEELFFVEIDNFLEDSIISHLPSAEQQPIVIENLEDSIEAAFRRYIPDPDRYDEVFTRSIERAATTVEERFSGLAQNYEATLRDLTGRLSVSLEAVGESIRGSLKEIMGDIRQQEETMISSRKQVVMEETERLRSVLAEVQATGLKAAAEYQQSAQAFQATTRESSEKSLAAARDLAARMSEVASMAANIEQLLQIEQAVQKGLEGVAASDDFRKTLGDLRTHLAATDAFCDRMSKPRIITLEEEPV
jgi:hypothetical protein